MHVHSRSHFSHTGGLAQLLEIKNNIRPLQHLPSDSGEALGPSWAIPESELSLMLRTGFFSVRVDSAVLYKRSSTESSVR